MTRKRRKKLPFFSLINKRKYTKEKWVILRINIYKIIQYRQKITVSVQKKIYSVITEHIIKRRKKKMKIWSDLEQKRSYLWRRCWSAKTMERNFFSRDSHFWSSIISNHLCRRIDNRTATIEMQNDELF